MAVWAGLGHAATVAQLVGADVGGLITKIIQAEATARQNKKEYDQLARRVLTIAELLQHLQDPEVLRPLTGLDDTLREAHELVMACQDKSAVYRLVMAGRQAEKFRDVQSRIDSYLLLFPVTSHMDITRRLERIYNILLQNNMAGPSMSPISMPQIPVPVSQDAAKMYWKEVPHGIQKFSFKELAKASINFAPDRKIGEGRFRSVYMGRLPDGREVAIKLYMYSRQVVREFLAEITILSTIRYKHIVSIYGYCVLVEEKWRHLLRPFRKEKQENKFLLVFEYMENGSLAHHLHGTTSSSSPVVASWKTRMEILLGVSRAIEYLQSSGEQPIIHRDVKPSNILFDVNWAPRLTDFGCALTGEEGDTNIICGTFGYMAPEYLMRGILNLTTDVYSFGVVMLVVLTGKEPYLFGEEWEERTREKRDEGEKTEECDEEEKREEGENTEEEESEREEEEEKTTEERHEWQKRDGGVRWSQLGLLKAIPNSKH
ncbi:proline-rich receptor-like protein kinase PERK9 [Oryza glaberrima]|uniref:proline-rich receptor-like protein kinase PERK9 n=1 Tax=Oryza glaberrima TaxID=4538 RepID=UPI00224C2DDF|nr:proline-rich receptor-like protein kinase PERK9 [Oryza glaberrima]